MQTITFPALPDYIFHMDDEIATYYKPVFEDGVVAFSGFDEHPWKDKYGYSFNVSELEGFSQDECLFWPYTTRDPKYSMVTLNALLIEAGGKKHVFLFLAGVFDAPTGNAYRAISSTVLTDRVYSMKHIYQRFAMYLSNPSMANQPYKSNRLVL